jgi:hypothetical protein
MQSESGENYTYTSKRRKGEFGNKGGKISETGEKNSLTRHLRPARAFENRKGRTELAAC